MICLVVMVMYLLAMMMYLVVMVTCFGCYGDIFGCHGNMFGCQGDDELNSLALQLASALLQKDCATFLRYFSRVGLFDKVVQLAGVDPSVADCVDSSTSDAPSVPTIQVSFCRNPTPPVYPLLFV